MTPGLGPCGLLVIYDVRLRFTRPESLDTVFKIIININSFVIFKVACHVPAVHGSRSASESYGIPHGLIYPQTEPLSHLSNFGTVLVVHVCKLKRYQTCTENSKIFAAG